jgi:hypothetical protein
MQNGGLFRGPAGVRFFTEPPNFGVEAHMEAPGEDALSLLYLRTGMAPCKSFFPRKP